MPTPCSQNPQLHNNFLHNNRLQHDWIEHFVHPNHPLFGVHDQRTVPQLTASNWQQSGLFKPNTQHYIYLNKAHAVQKNTALVCVNCCSLHAQHAPNVYFFESERAALQFANDLYREGSAAA